MCVREWVCMFVCDCLGLCACWLGRCACESAFVCGNRKRENVCSCGIVWDGVCVCVFVYLHVLNRTYMCLSNSKAHTYSHTLSLALSLSRTHTHTHAVPPRVLLDKSKAAAIFR